MKLSTRISLLTFQLVFLIFGSTLTYAQQTGANEVENKIKATYLYKFISYVEWPAFAFLEPNAPFVIGIIGSEGIAASLKSLITVEGQMMNNHPIEVAMLKPEAPHTKVQILFISKHENAELKNILSATQTQPILTVTESEKGLNEGSIINFITDDNRVRFNVSVAQAERSGLKISARLLGVAKKIETNK
jgi:hypothetical protein